MIVQAINAGGEANTLHFKLLLSKRYLGITETDFDIYVRLFLYVYLLH